MSQTSSQVSLTSSFVSHAVSYVNMALLTSHIISSELPLSLTMSQRCLAPPIIPPLIQHYQTSPMRPNILPTDSCPPLPLFILTPPPPPPPQVPIYFFFFFTNNK